MADEVKVELTLEDKKFVKAIKNATEKVDNFGDAGDKAFKKTSAAFDVFIGNVAANATTAAFNALSTGMSKVVTVFEKGIDAAQRQQVSLNKLRTALESSGQASQQTFNRLVKFSAMMEKTTTVGDEAAQEMIAFAISMGATAEQAEKIIQVSADMSAQMGTDLQSNVRNLTKTLGGLKGELGETISELRNVTQEQLQSGAAIDIVAKKFEGAARKEVNTFSGAIAQAENSMGGLLEKIGDIVVRNPLVIAALNKASQIFIKLDGFIGRNLDTIISFVNDGLLMTIKGIALLTKPMAVLNTAFQIIEGTVKSAFLTFKGFGDILGLIGKAIVTGDFAGLSGKIKDVFTQSFEGVKETVREGIKDTIEGVETADTAKRFLDNLGKDLKRRSRQKPLEIDIKSGTIDIEGQQRSSLTATERKKIEEEEKVRQKVAGDLARAGAIAPFRGGEGGRALIGAGVTAGAQAFGADPQTAGVMGQIATELTKGSDNTREMFREFASTFPIMIGNLFEAAADLPVIIAEELIPRMPEVAERLGQAMPKVVANFAKDMPKVTAALIKEMPNVAIEFIKGIIDGAGDFIQALIDELKDKLKLDKIDEKVGKALGVSGGGSGGGAVEAVKTIATGGLNKVFGFADGGLVPFVPGVPSTGDNVGAALNPGEIVLNKEMQSNLVKMLQGGGSSGGSSTVVNVQGNVIANDDAEVDRLVRRIQDAIEFRNVNLGV